jgi:ABC-2 type transport system ATP-binding protein
VTVTAAPDKVGQIRRALDTLQGIAKIEERKLGTEEVALTLFPAKEVLLIENVSALVMAQGLSVKGLYAEAGRLDEVFRRLTTPDAGPASPSVGEAA